MPFPSIPVDLSDADCHECCEEGQPCCNGTIPNTLYATFASSCLEWDGQVVVLNWDGSAWRGRYEGILDACDVEIALTCASESLAIADFILGDGSQVFTENYETADCDPVGIVFGGVNNNEEHPCCVGANLDVTVTT